MYRYEGTEQIRQDSAPTRGAQKRFMDDFTFDAIVIGAGHAGVEAGLALARTGCRTLMLSVTLDNVAYLACNPSVGGTAKGHLVREIDALGGEMGRRRTARSCSCACSTAPKARAVQSLRAQVDKYRYHEYMKRTLETQDNLELRQGEAAEILTESGRVCGVRTAVGLTYRARAVVLACGVYLKSDIIIGPHIEHKGPVCFQRAEHLSGALLRLGISLRRFKTGTPARVHRDSVDFSKLEVQRGETDIYSFSALSKCVAADKAVCWLGWTNERTHDIIRKNLHRAPKYSGLIHGVGARYCPSIEDKIVRFADKERHQFFLEPEGTGTAELYVQGLSTSLPADVQLEMYRSIAGFERVKIMRDAYAIEYDCIDPTILAPTLEHKEIGGLYFAGQINGTSGYEEAGGAGTDGRTQRVAGAQRPAAARFAAQRGVYRRHDRRSGDAGHRRAVPHDDLPRRVALETPAGQRRHPPHRKGTAGRARLRQTVQAVQKSGAGGRRGREAAHRAGSGGDG